MKRYLLNIFLFFAIVLAIDVAVGSLGDYLQTHAVGGDTKRINDLVNNDKHDIIIMGSSRAHRHYDTPYLSDTLGLDVYNAGYDGNGCVLAYGLLSMILERYQPKLVLFDVEPCFDFIEYKPDNHHVRYIGYLKPYFRNDVVGDIIRDVSLEEWYKVHSGLIRYNSKLIPLSIDNFRYSYDENRGYEPLIGVMEDEVWDTQAEPVKIDSFKLQYMEKMLLLAKNNNIPFAVVASPKYSMKNSDSLAPVKELCEKYSIPFIDYYAETEFMHHRDWFREQMHLNQKGAKAFSSLIAREISNIVN